MTTGTDEQDIVNVGALRLWAEALESGDYDQTDAVLRDENSAYCCLGVLCEVAAKQGVIDGAEECREFDTDEICGYHYDGATAYLPQSVSEWAFGEPTDNPRLIGEDGNAWWATTLNDADNYSFAQIAAAVRRTYKLEG